MADVATNPITNRTKPFRLVKDQISRARFTRFQSSSGKDGILLLLLLLELFPILIFHIETGLEDPFLLLLLAGKISFALESLISKGSGHSCIPGFNC